MPRVLRLSTLLLAACTAPAFAQDATPPARLKAAFGAGAIDAVQRFDYRLTVVDAQQRVLSDRDFVLLPGTRRLYARDRTAPEPRAVWSGDDGSWRLRDGQWEFLGATPAAAYRQHVAYHYLPMLRDPATQYRVLDTDRIELTPAGVPAFVAQLDPASGHIREIRFDGGLRSRELEHRMVGALSWPTVYETFGSDGALLRRGRFADMAVGGEVALPAMPVAAAALQLPTAERDVARLVGAGWLSGAGNDYNLSLDANERLLVFARSAPEFEHAQIWLARRAGEQWSRPEPVRFSDPRYSDSDPWLTPDGRTLYFISNRPRAGEAARKDLDLWRVAVHARGFGTPEPLTALNSDGQELGPELHDGWLYFNSTRKGGPAPMAIYRARIVGDRIEAPQALAGPFNTGKVQGDFTLSPDGRTALFWSVRGDSPDADLFAARREGEAWSDPIRLPSPINAAGMDFTPSFSADGRTLRFASMRKPAWLDDAAHVFNGQSNLYVVPAAMLEQALAKPE